MFPAEKSAMSSAVLLLSSLISAIHHLPLSLTTPLGYVRSTYLCRYGHTPTVSPSTIPLVYYHINSFQQASGVERPLPGGENRTAGRASHHEELCSDWVVAPPVWTTGLSLI